jgi:hypothetical protein
MVYLSMSSAVPGFGNSVVPFDTNAGTFGPPTWIGSEPGVGVISSDEQYLYVDISGACSILRLNLTKLTPDLEFSYCGDYDITPSTYVGGGRPQPVSALLNVPNAPSTSIAVSRGPGGVAIYDNAVKRSEVAVSNAPGVTGPAPFTDSAQFSPKGDFLFGIGEGDGFSRWHVTPNGFELDVVQPGIYGGFNNTLTLLCFEAQAVLCSTSAGYLVDPIALTTIRIFGATGQVSGIQSSGPVVADPANDRIYFLNSGIQLYGFSISSGQATGTLLLNLNLDDEFASQMQLLPSGELLILTNASIHIVPTKLIHNL